MTKLEKYAKLIISKGVNIQPGQKLLIRCPVNLAYFSRVLTQLAWEAGAADVFTIWSDEETDRIRYLHAPDDVFGQIPKWVNRQIKYIVDNGYNVVNIYSIDPESLKDVSSERISKDLTALSRTNKPLTDQLITNAIQWCLIGVPNSAWAKKVFPDAATEEEAIAKMWEAIYHAARVDDHDPIENWNKHIAHLTTQADKLMKHNFSSLTFKNSLGTDLTVTLPQGHIWVSCGEIASTGHAFVANIPTEEVFTAPHRAGTNGIVYASKPLTYMGNIIDQFWIKFKNGQAIEWDAEIGKEFLDKLITTHPNADYLGEVALVPSESPISQSGILWYNTLFDENASCHLALGRGYDFNLSGTANKSQDELMDMGLNQSLEHTDFMIGSADLSITGVSQTGEIIQVFKDGEWAL